MLRVLLELDRSEEVQREPHVVGELRDDHLAHRRLVGHGGPRRVELVEDDHHARGEVLDLVSELSLGVERVVPHRDRAETLARVPRDHVLRGVREEQPHPVAPLDAEPGEDGAESFHLVQQLAIRQVLAEERDRRGVGKSGRGIGEEMEDALVWERGDGLRHAPAPDPEPRAVVGHPRIIG